MVVIICCKTNFRCSGNLCHRKHRIYSFIQFIGKIRFIRFALYIFSEPIFEFLEHRINDFITFGNDARLTVILGGRNDHPCFLPHILHSLRIHFFCAFRIGGFRFLQRIFCDLIDFSEHLIPFHRCLVNHIMFKPSQLRIYRTHNNSLLRNAPDRMAHSSVISSGSLRSRILRAMISLPIS